MDEKNWYHITEDSMNLDWLTEVKKKMLEEQNNDDILLFFFRKVLFIQFY